MNISAIHEVTSGGYVYHDGTSIRGIAFAPDAALAKYDRLTIPLEQAIQFVKGELKVDDWFVFTTSIGAALYTTTGEIHLDVVGDKFELLMDRPQRHAIMLLVTAYREDQQIVFELDSKAKLTSSLSNLSFIITKQDDPSAVLHQATVSLDELLDTRSVRQPLPIDPEIAIDVYTRPVFPCYRLRHCTSYESTLALPYGHFIDLMRCETQAIERGLQAIVARDTATLHLSVVGAAETFERSISSLSLLFTMPDDPTLILHGTSVALDTVKDGVSLTLPEFVVEQPFDLWLPLLYRRASLIDA